MREVVIASAARTAVGRLGGSLKDVPEDELMIPVLKAVLGRAGVAAEQLDEVILAQNYRSGELHGNSARNIVVKAGFPIELPAITISKACAGAIRTITLAAQIIKSGEAEAVLVGGLENMSRAAFLVPGIRWGINLRHGQLKDQLLMFDPVCGLSMGETAEKVAELGKISREEQDEFALWSQQKAEKAIKEGKFKEEIVPINIPQRKGPPVVFETDEHPRFGLTLPDLAKLPPVFKKDGTVTAGNSCGMNDAAAALLVMSGEKAASLGLKPLAKIVSYASVGVDPSIMGTGPVPATRLALEKAGLALEEIDLIELNEAFASICLYFIHQFNPAREKINVNGGAIALGHPISATGGVITAKLLYELKRRSLRYGLATMCIGGGQGIALIVENLNVSS